MKKSERIIISCTILIMVLVLIISSTYAFFSYDSEQKELNEFAAPCYDVTYAQKGKDNVQILNAYPSTDEEGLKQTPYTVTVTNNCPNTITYNTIMNVTEDSTTPNNLMKVGVTHDSEDEILELKNITPDETSSEFPYRYILTTDSLEQGKSKTYDFRAWMNENVKITDEENGLNTSFINKISIELIQRETKTILGVTYPVIKEEYVDFTKGFPNDSSTPEEILLGSGLYKTEDNDGPSYIFRGQVENNYVKFASKGWRIIRLNGDGTIRLILEGSLTPTSYNTYVSDGTAKHELAGYTYNNTPCTKDDPCQSTYQNSAKFNNTHGGTNSNIKTKLEEWYYNNLKNYDDKIEYSIYCNDTSYGSGTDDMSSTHALNYGAYDRVINKNKPSLICPNPTDAKGQLRRYGGVYKLKIGTMTGDELNFVGLSPTAPYAASTNYIYENSNYGSGIVSYAMTPGTSNSEILVFGTGWINDEVGAHRGIVGSRYLGGLNHSIYPVINIKANVKATGTGTKTDPLVIK